MANQAKKLLVEGEADTRFFEAFLREAGISDVWVGPPKAFGGNAYGKGNAINLLPDLIQSLADGSSKRLGLIVDADFSETDLGFGKTWNKITKILGDYGYNVPNHPPNNSVDFVFEHNDGLPNFGLWIMPSNSSDGLLEDFIKASVVASEKALFVHAVKTVSALPEKKFKDIHISKAEVATWLAWQTMPGQGLQGVIGGNLLELETNPAKQFIDWLKKVYEG